MHRYIAIEGIDGSGTTTVSKRVAAELNAMHTAEPWIGSTATSLIRNALTWPESRAREDALCFAFLFQRVELLALVEERLAFAGERVVSDRCFWSTFAYQSRAFDVAWLARTVPARKPDLIVLLDLPVDVAMTRKPPQDNYDSNRAIQEHAHIMYRLLATETLEHGSPAWEDVEVVIVDATQDVETVVDKVLSLIHT